MALKLLIYFTAFVLANASITDLFKENDNDFSMKEFFADIDQDQQEDLTITVDYEHESQLMSLYFVISQKQEDILIEFNYHLDLKNPYDAQWVDKERGMIVIQR